MGNIRLFNHCLRLFILITIQLPYRVIAINIKLNTGNKDRKLNERILGTRTGTYLMF